MANELFFHCTVNNHALIINVTFELIFANHMANKLFFHCTVNNHALIINVTFESIIAIWYKYNCRM